MKRRVLNAALSCPRLMDDERSCDGSAFQTAQQGTGKLRRPSCVLVEGTSMSWRSAKQRFARPEMPATGMQTLLKKAGNCSRTQSNAEIAILNCISLYSHYHGDVKISDIFVPFRRSLLV